MSQKIEATWVAQEAAQLVKYLTLLQECDCLSFCVNCLSQTILPKAFQCKNVQMVKFKERKWLRFWTIGEVQVLGGPESPSALLLLL